MADSIVLMSSLVNKSRDSSATFVAPLGTLEPVLKSDIIDNDRRLTNTFRPLIMYDWRAMPKINENYRTCYEWD